MLEVCERAASVVADGLFRYNPALLAAPEITFPTVAAAILLLRSAFTLSR